MQRESSRPWVLPLTVASLFWVSLLCLGTIYHTVPLETPSTAERDDYVGRAETLLAGRLPESPYHPLLYPIVTAGVSFLTRDAFAAGRMVSSLAAACVVIMTYAIARRLHPSRAVAIVAMLLVALNHAMWTLGIEVSAHMLFTALGTLVLLCSLRLLDGLTLVCTLLTALAFAMCYFTRYQAMLFLPCIALAIWLAPVAHWRSRLIHGLTFLGASAIFLVPHGMLTAAKFGSPFHNENWKNPVWRWSGRDFGAFDTITRQTLGEILRESPLRPLEVFITNTMDFCASHFALLWTGGQTLGTRWIDLLAFVFAVSSLLGLAVWLRRIDRPRMVATAFVGAYTVVTFLTFSAEHRYIVPCLPVMALLLAMGIQAVIENLWAGMNRDDVVPFRVACTAVLLLLAFSTLSQIQDWVSRHPYEEFQAAREILRQDRSSGIVLGSSPYLHRVAGLRYVTLPFPYQDLQSPTAYLDMVNDQLRRNNGQLVILGRLSLYADFDQIVLTAEQDRRWHVVRASANVAVLAVVAQSPTSQ